MSKMISVASGFQYSVNIGYDLNNDDKLKNFIPTKSALMLLKDILSSTALDATERARVLVGAYGKGKSHIILTILSVLMQRDRSLFTHLMPKINEDPELKQLVDNYYSDKKNRILPVIINGTSGSLPQAFLLALQRTLDENGLDIMPETNYRAAINAIQKWKADYPKTYDKFKKEISLPVDAFISELNDYNAAIYSEFEEVYPKLTSGSIFNPFVGFDVVELYESVVKSLKQRGYLGIYVVYDEFSKFLESNITAASVSDTKMLQDFAEKCNRSSENELHLLLISHKEISNYIDQLPKAKVDGWRGVSERFRHIHLNNNFAQTYEIISTVIIKDRDKWEDFQDNNKARFDQLMSRYAEHAIFSDTDQKELETTIYECYPLHPVSTFILPRLSERVAQNERTLFTFLSADGTSTLPAFLRGLKDKDFRVITPDLIFDYFDPVLQKEPFAGELHKNYVLTKTILGQIEDQILESKIVKTISLIYLLGQFDKLKPIKEEIVGIYSMEYKPAEIEAAIEHLIKDEYVIYLKRSNDYLKLKQTSGVDVEQKISDTIAALTPSFSLKSALNALNIDNYLYPSKYNDEKEMIRYFEFEFIEEQELEGDIDWVKKAGDINADGVVYAIICENPESIMIKDKHGKYKLSKRGEILALKRSRVVAGAMQKLEALKREITPYKDDNNILVYCGATRVIDDSDTSSDDESDIRQIEAVTKILGNELNMNVARFTSEENMEERALIKEHFQDGGKLQAIVAIKCLDEGVNIPGIRTAFILASTTNPKEYIQRRGRVLRKAANKPFAEIYDFVTLPRPLDSVSGLTIEQANRDKTLVKNELARIKEFGRLALNSMLANNLIWDIQEAYHLNETDLEKEGEDFE